jgi:hypothetical protein
MINCECCGQLAYAKHTYGVYEIAGKSRLELGIPMNEVYLCKKSSQELFDRIKDSVASHHMYYSVESPL